MKKYLVSRKYTTEDFCYVEAKNKKEAIQKAKNDDFFDDGFESSDWDGGNCFNIRDFKAKEVKER